MEVKEMQQKELKPKNGLAMLFLLTLGELVSIAAIVFGSILMAYRRMVGGVVLLTAGILLCLVFSIMYAGLRVVGPNEALVLTLFGGYYGTILKPGFFWVNPFTAYNNPVYRRELAQAKTVAQEKAAKGQLTAEAHTLAKKTVSLKRATLNNGMQKVNDVLGNPVVIGAVVIWRVENPTKAVFNVEDYAEFLSIQTDSTVRNIARMYPYDSYEAEEESGDMEKTLRGSAQEIANSMKEELEDRVKFAGLEIEEVRITHLAYSEEIAGAMLQRQQASAIIAARQKIVDGAVGMVKMAIDKLGSEEVVVLDEERKAAMVSNLLVVLCSNKDTQPIVNSGSIY